MKEGWKPQSENEDGCAVTFQIRADAPNGVAANCIGAGTTKPPHGQGRSVREVCERQEQKRDLWRIEREISNPGGRRYAAGCDGTLRIDVIQSFAAVFDRQRAQRVEVQKVGTFEIAIAVAQAGRGDDPDINRP